MVVAEKTDILGSDHHTNRLHDQTASPPAYSAVEHKPADDEDDVDSSVADVESLNTPDYTTLNDLEDGPDVDHPFAFPTSELPAYTTSKHIDRPLAVPQVQPSSTASFLQAYPPILLSYGIPATTWLDFLATLSGFLNNHAGKNAVFHATKIAQDYSDIHVNLGKDLVSHTESHLRNIGESIKKGNPLAIVGSAVSWPLGVASQIVGTVLQVPGALVQKPQTPRQRADVYLAAANSKWFHARDLHAMLISTYELTEYLRTSRPDFLGVIQERKNSEPSEQLDALRPWLGELSLDSGPAATAAAAAAAAGSASTLAGGPSRPDLRNANSSTSTSSWKSGKGKGKFKAPKLQLGIKTLWVVLVQKSDVHVPPFGQY